MWCSREDSNLQQTTPEAAASAGWATRARWCSDQDSNLGPLPCEGSALPLRYRGRFPGDHDPGVVSRHRVRRPLWGSPPGLARLELGLARRAGIEPAIFAFGGRCVVRCTNGARKKVAPAAGVEPTAVWFWRPAQPRGLAGAVSPVALRDRSHKWRTVRGSNSRRLTPSPVFKTGALPLGQPSMS